MKYRPSNGVEGMDFMSRYCDRCARDAAFRDGTGDSCPIAAASMRYKVEDDGYPSEWQYSNDGPTCAAFEPEAS